MELSPQAISSMEFELVRRGYDTEQVREFLSRLAAAVEEMRAHLLASDARARAAMARVQELSAAATPNPQATSDAEAITKALLLAQKAADQTVADAEQQANRMIAEAEQRAQSIRAQANATVAEAQTTADDLVRRTEVATRTKMEAELQTLANKRAALQNEADILRGQIVAMRDNIGDVVEELQRVLRSPRRSFASPSDTAASEELYGAANGANGANGSHDSNGSGSFVATSVSSFSDPVGFAAEFAELDLAPINLAPPPMPTVSASTDADGDFASIADMWSKPEAPSA